MKLKLGVGRSKDGSYFISNHFFGTEEEAQFWMEECYVGLWDSGPSIEIKNYEPQLPPEWGMKKRNHLKVKPVEKPVKKKETQNKPTPQTQPTQEELGLDFDEFH